MIISFDFDETLNTPSGEAYAKELISRGYEIHVTTQRPPMMYKDVFKVTRRVGVKIENIHFCGVNKKRDILNNIEYIFHLDDNKSDCIDVYKAILFDNNFKDKCEEVIRNYREL